MCVFKGFVMFVLYVCGIVKCVFVYYVDVGSEFLGEFIMKL